MRDRKGRHAAALMLVISAEVAKAWTQAVVTPAGTRHNVKTEALEAETTRH
jgi:hypothetical protein